MSVFNKRKLMLLKTLIANKTVYEILTINNY